MIRLPGLIDPHVHLRDPGQTHKEDFLSGTSAALAGGYTIIFDMPNNIDPIITEKDYRKNKNRQRKYCLRCWISLRITGKNFLMSFLKYMIIVLGLKVYLNQTTGNYIVDEKVFQNICIDLDSSKLILVHAEEDILESILKIAKIPIKKIHVCHVSSRSELEIIIKAKINGQKVTCGVTPHHLFLNSDDENKLGPFGKMKPALKPKSDTNFLWNNLEYIDVVESDHAPHTVSEKQADNPPYGVPGLETTLPLLLTAMNDGRLTIVDIKRLCYDNASRILG